MAVKKALPSLALCFFYMCGGLDFIVLDKLTSSISPITVIFLRFFVATIVLITFCKIRKIKLKINNDDYKWLILCGAIGFSLYFTFESMGIQKTSGSMASLMMATIPIWGLIGDRVICKNKITPVKGVCSLLSIAGVVMIVTGASGAEMSGTIIGIVFMLIAALAFTVYILLVKPLREKYDLAALTTNLFIVATIVEFPVFLLNKPEEIMIINGSQWVMLVVAAILFIGLAQLLYIWGVGQVSVTTGALYANLLPLVTVIVSFFAFGEVLEMQQMIGGIVILITVTISSIIPDTKESEK